MKQVTGKWENNEILLQILWIERNFCWGVTTIL